jgi:tRNA pseudouridine38-40 synthase
VTKGEVQSAASTRRFAGRHDRPANFRFKAVVEYDGTDYLGFQVQGPASACGGKSRTIQGELERALLQVTQQPTRVVGAGRTDAGVHARGQVIHFDVSWRHSLPDLQRALNATLPSDIAVLALGEAAQDFHARFSARSREYEYSILNRSVRSPLEERYAYLISRPLDAGAMDRACRCLVGTHDFLAFGWPPRGENTVRTVTQAECHRVGEFVYLRVEADAFLRSMVRRMVGNLILVGLGELSVEGMAGLLTQRHRRTPAVAAPAHGLCLDRVNY